MHLRDKKIEFQRVESNFPKATELAVPAECHKAISNKNKSIDTYLFWVIAMLPTIQFLPNLKIKNTGFPKYIGPTFFW